MEEIHLELGSKLFVIRLDFYEQEIRTSRCTLKRGLLIFSDLSEEKG